MINERWMQLKVAKVSLFAGGGANGPEAGWWG